MKGTVLFSLTLLLLSALFLSNSFAQDNPQWRLPDDAIARFGKGWIAGLQYSPDGSRLAVATAIGIWLYDTATLQEVDLLTGQTAIYSSLTYSPSAMAYSPVESILASGGWDRTIRLWDTTTGEDIKTLTGHRSGIRSLAFSPDGKIIASGSYDRTVRLWDVDTGETVHTLTEHTDRVTSVAFSPNGDMVASGSWDQTVRLWDVATGELIRTITGHTSLVRAVAFGPDGDTVASGDYDAIIRVVGRWHRRRNQNTHRTYLHYLRTHFFG